MPIHSEFSKQEARVSDRQLGEEWEEWDGTRDPGDTRATVWLFYGLAGAGVVLLVLLAWLAAWLTAPRFAAWNAQGLVTGLAGFGTGYLLVWYGALGISLSGAPFFLPVVRRLGGIRWCLPLVLGIGKLLGVNRDRLGHAFILAHNRFETPPPPVPLADRLLVLVPRCLGREAFQGLSALKTRYGFAQVTVGGGSEARRAIARMRPLGIIAVACERDLLSGIHDVGGKIPVLGFSNQRPDGPCKNTRVDLEQIEGAIKMFLGLK